MNAKLEVFKNASFPVLTGFDNLLSEERNLNKMDNFGERFDSNFYFVYDAIFWHLVRLIVQFLLIHRLCERNSLNFT